MRKINKIIIHCSATPEGREHDVADIRRWHLKRGFNDIGYHYLIHIDGTIEEGRPLNKQGAHCSTENKGSIGLCYVGGMSKDMKKAKDTRTQAQKDSLIKLIHELIYKYNKDMTIHGHNEYANKACPSFNVQEEYANL
ncbi:N-acetylmuramoyl-L-alanine amidase [uncultured Mediterranean phage uvDeep-CGR1-KM17-C101]|nr:N-acetylmuramoyl-L-alanine amidase [uncultured Mediterranean phage uvDeep-CGR1-KM17-C101]